MLPAVRRLLPYLLRYRLRFALGLASVAVTTGVSLASPWVLKYAIARMQRIGRSRYRARMGEFYPTSPTGEDHRRAERTMTLAERDRR